LIVCDALLVPGPAEIAFATSGHDGGTPDPLDPELVPLPELLPPELPVLEPLLPEVALPPELPLVELVLPEPVPPELVLPPELLPPELPLPDDDVEPPPSLPEESPLPVSVVPQCGAAATIASTDRMDVTLRVRAMSSLVLPLAAARNLRRARQ
jgi:hypothetical protein